MANAWSELSFFDDEELSELDVESLPTLFPDASAVARNATIELEEDRALTRRAKGRDYLQLLQVDNAAKHLARLPAEGESIHCVMRGNYNAWDLVPAVLQLASPATIDALWVATLGFNKSNAEELLALVDHQQIKSVAFVCSSYFKSTTGDLFGFLHYELSRRQQRVAALRSHAKILLFEMSDGRALVIESSANLRSCRNIEQFTFTHDAELLAFHRDWIDLVLREAGA